MMGQIAVRALVGVIVGLLGVGSGFDAAAAESTERIAVNGNLAVSDANLVRLVGNTHYLARPEFDKGLVDPQLPLQRLQLVLRRSAAQDAALQAFMDQQLDPNSANFHHWLGAEEFGRLYGPSDADITAVSSWLRAHSFSVDSVSKGRVTLEFSGTAGQVQEAFHTEIHHYLVGGTLHLANDRDPQIPAALAPVITGIASLHDFFPKHQSQFGRHVRMNRQSHQVVSIDAPVKGPAPQYGFADPNVGGILNEDIGPYDFAALYNLTPLWKAGITGKGVSIAIASQTDIHASDVSTFRSFFGLSKFSGTVKQVINGADPGIIAGDLEENTLDTEWSGAAAPDAQVIVVASKGTATSSGGLLSIEYIVDEEVAKIMSASYGICEAGAGKATNALLNGVYQQGSAEGISLFESAGDQGSTGCDNSDATVFPAPAENGLQVNAFASSPYITGVGGTDIVWQEEPYDKYWTANNSDNASAIGYIPEVPWNSTCTSTYLLKYVYTGQPSSEALCNIAAVTDGVQDLVRVVGGSGGKSSCLTNSGTFASCSGAYAKPAWQTGTGVPNDGVRDVPDVSLFASGGLPAGNGGSAYLICVSSESPDKKCDYSGDDITAQEVGGTSVSSPAMAGIMALVLQETGSAQGLANPVLYKLAAKDNLSSCNSNTVGNGNSCIFYDVTSGTNAMPCLSGTLNCVVKTSGDHIGIVSGYSATKGYDLATGLGSVNAYNLVHAWPSSPSATLSLSPTSVSFGNTAVGSTSTAQVVTVKNSGTSAVTITSIGLSGAQADDFALTKTCGSTLAAGASCTASVTFKPVSTGAKAASISIADTASGSPQTVALTGTGTTSSGSAAVKLSATSLAFADQAVGTTSGAKTVTVTNSGSAALTFTAISLTGGQADDYSLTKTCGSSLAGGASCTLSVTFKPVSTGPKIASVSIADNASGSPQTVALTGTGTTSSGSAAVKLSATSLAFGNQKAGTTSAAKSVTITNSGSATLTFTSINLAGQADDFVLSKTCASTLAAGASCTLSVSFDPVSTGAKSASVSIADNASGSPQTVALTGTGTTSSGSASVKLSATSLTFATQKAGTTSAAKSVTVTNSGSATLTFTSILLAGSQADDFVLSKTCTSTLAAGASCTLSVSFDPVSAGAKSASVSIADNASGSPQAVGLTGTGE